MNPPTQHMFSETIMASSTDSNVKEENSQVTFKKDINTKTSRILQNKKHANNIFDVIEYLQVCDSYFTVDSIRYILVYKYFCYKTYFFFSLAVRKG